MNNEIYYRVMINNDFGVSIPTMQWFDEYDYDQKRFITDKKFNSKEEAEDWILTNRSMIMECIDVSRKMGYPMFNAVSRSY